MLVCVCNASLPKIECLLVKFDRDRKCAKMLLKAEELLTVLQKREKELDKQGCVTPRVPFLWSSVRYPTLHFVLVLVFLFSGSGIRSPSCVDVGGRWIPLSKSKYPQCVVSHFANCRFEYRLCKSENLVVDDFSY
jgi:hypothetical protein